MKLNSTHFPGSLLCLREKKFFQFVTFPSKRCALQTMPRNGAYFSQEIEKIIGFKAALGEKDA
jgi:hypothetical protein